MVKAQASGVRYVLLMTSDGLYVSSTHEGLAVAAEAGDGTCWTLDRSSSDGGAGPLIFHHPSTKVTMQGAPATLPDGTARGEGVVAAAGIAPACTLRCPRPVPASGSAAATATTGASYVSGAENAVVVSHFYTKNDQFTKTGSTQTYGHAENRGVVRMRRDGRDSRRRGGCRDVPRDARAGPPPDGVPRAAAC